MANTSIINAVLKGCRALIWIGSMFVILSISSFADNRPFVCDQFLVRIKKQEKWTFESQELKCRGEFTFTKPLPGCPPQESSGTLKITEDGLPPSDYKFWFTQEREKEGRTIAYFHLVEDGPGSARSSFKGLPTKFVIEEGFQEYRLHAKTENQITKLYKKSVSINFY